MQSKFCVKAKTDSEKKLYRISERNMSSRVINILSLIAIVLVCGVYFNITNSITIALVTTAIMMVMAFFFTAVASYIVGLVGNSNSSRFWYDNNSSIVYWWAIVYLWIFWN